MSLRACRASGSGVCERGCDDHGLHGGGGAGGGDESHGGMTSCLIRPCSRRTREPGADEQQLFLCWKTGCWMMCAAWQQTRASQCLRHCWQRMWKLRAAPCPRCSTQWHGCTRCTRPPWLSLAVVDCRDGCGVMMRWEVEVGVERESTKMRSTVFGTHTTPPLPHRAEPAFDLGRLDRFAWLCSLSLLRCFLKKS